MPKTCCYIKTGGARCGALALTEQNFCFWHNKVNRHHAEANHPKFPKFYDPKNEVKYRQENRLADEYYSDSRVNGPTADELPPLEDPESIQLAISMVLGSLADFRIEPKRAQLMLYGLQLAMYNERRMRPAAEHSVTDIVTNDFGVEMAAPSLPDPVAIAPAAPDPAIEVRLPTPSEPQAHAQNAQGEETHELPGAPFLVSPDPAIVASPELAQKDDVSEPSRNALTSPPASNAAMSYDAASSPPNRVEETEQAAA